MLSTSDVLDVVAIIDAVDVGVVFYDQRGTVIDLNDVAAQFVGGSKESVIGATAKVQARFSVKRDGTRFSAAELPVVVALEERRPVKFDILGFDLFAHPRKWLRGTVAPVFVPGVVEGAVALYLDITESAEHGRMLDLLSKVNRIVKTTESEATLLQQLCDVLVDDGGYSLAAVGVPSPAGDCIDFPYGAGATGYLAHGMVSSDEAGSLGNGPIGIAFRTRTTQVANNFADDPRLGPWRERAKSFHLASAAAIPLTTFHPAILVVYDKHTFGFTRTIVGGLEDIAQAADGVGALMRSLSDVRQALDGTISALAMMTEKRDPYTEGHQIRVGVLSEAIAFDLGLDDHLGRLIRLAGEVHDVGKIEIPSEILARPGVLSSLEFEMVRQHCKSGFDILQSAGLEWPIAEVALQHHERVNGSGYPRGLAGDQIILPARIVAVADVVEAMSNHRPYRPALGLDAALAEIERGKGTLFDPDVVDSCLKLFETGYAFDSAAAPG